MDNQATFDKVAKHMLTQNACAIDEGKGLCMYRAPGGLACAAGCLIPDEKYTPDLEAKICTEGNVAQILRDEGHDPSFVRSLQLIHDGILINNEGPRHWRRKLITLAKAHGLDPAVCMHTEQETFDKVATHLLTQGKPARGEYFRKDYGTTKSGCMYRSPEGLACAAGCLIPDEKYTPELEGLRASHTIIQNILEGEGHGLAIVCSLQRIHDLGDATPTLWLERLRELAVKRGLSTKVLDEHTQAA